MGELTEVPSWFMYSIVAPLIIAASIGGAGSIGTMIAMNETVKSLEGTVSELRVSVPSKSYVDNKIDRLSDLTDGKIHFLQYQIKQNESAIATNHARIQDNRASMSKQSVWNPPFRFPHGGKQTMPVHYALSGASRLFPRD